MPRGGGRSSRPLDKGVGGRSPEMFLALRASVSALKIKGRWVPRAPPLDPPLYPVGASEEEREPLMYLLGAQ